MEPKTEPTNERTNEIMEPVPVNQQTHPENSNLQRLQSFLRITH